MKKISFCCLTTCLTAAILVLWALLFPITGNEMGYCILSYYVIFPLTTFICGLLLGLGSVSFKVSCKISWQIGYVLLSGILGIIMPIPVFYNIQLFVGMVGISGSSLGLVLGNLIRILCRVRLS